jgi:hypothetical protein
MAPYNSQNLIRTDSNYMHKDVLTHMIVTTTLQEHEIVLNALIRFDEYLIYLELLHNFKLLWSVIKMRVSLASLMIIFYKVPKCLS